MKILKLLSDHLLVAEDPPRIQTTGGIYLPNPKSEPIRTGRILMAGPGRRYIDKFIPMPDDMVGQRVVFMAAASDSKQGLQIRPLLEEGQRLIRLGDVLGVITGNVEVRW